MRKRLQVITRSALSVALTTVLAFSMVPCFAAPAAAAEPVAGDSASPIPDGADIVPGEVVVVFENGVSAEQANDAIDSAASVSSSDVSAGAVGSSVPSATVEVAEGSTEADAIRELESDPRVAFAQPNYRYTLPAPEISSEDALAADEGDASASADDESLRPLGKASANDPERTTQWYLSGVDALGAWDIAECDNKVTVAVIDSGIEMAHPDLVDNIVAPYDLVGDARADGTASVPDESPDDELGHGTHVAGIVAARANNGTGIAGVSYNANIMPLKVFYYSQSAKGYVCETSDLLAAYRYILADAGDGTGQTRAQKLNVRVINMSLGAIWNEEQDTGDKALLAAVDEAYSKGILTVCAAGNDEYELPYKNWPSDYDTCVSVIATTENNGKASFSNYGPEKDIAAPGSNIYSTYPSTLGYGQGYVSQSGTSMASPVVSGVAALMWAANPSLTPDQVKNVLYQTAIDLGDPGFDDQFANGKVNAREAVRGAAGFSTTPVERIESLPTSATAGEPLALRATVSPAEASQNVIFSIKDAGTTAAVISGSSLVASHAGTVVLLATVLGGNADGSNYVQEFSVVVTGDGSNLWNGTADTSWYNADATEFELSTPEQLAGLSAIVGGVALDADGKVIARDNFYGKVVRLAADMKLNAVAADGPSSAQRGWKPIGDINISGEEGSSTDVCFDGTFDGQGHLISNIYIDGAEGSSAYGGYQGFFGALGSHAVVSNFGIDGGWIFGRVAGGIAACSRVATSDQIPRIAACFNSATIENYGSSSRGVGGIFGGENQAGGHSGASSDAFRAAASIADCYNMGTIKGYLGCPAGGIAGVGSVVVENCYNAGDVESQGTYVGALVGMLLMSGAVVPEAAGDFSPAGMVVNSLGLAGTSPNLYRFQDADHPSNDTAGTVSGLTSDDALKASASVLGSSFAANDAGGYPLLFWQCSLGTIDLSDGTVAPIADQLYTGAPVVPNVTVSVMNPNPPYSAIVLSEGSDYLVIGENNTEPGMASLTIRGTGRFTGELHATFNIVKANIAECIIDDIPSQWIYGDEAAEPRISVKTPGGVKLRQGSDYTLEFRDNDREGEATVVVRAAGSGTYGEATRTFYVGKASGSLEGAGTKESPFLVSSKADLQFVSHMVNSGDASYAAAHYLLTTDVDASPVARSPLSIDPIGVGMNRFGGSFDGGGHTITVDLRGDALSSAISFDPTMQTLALFSSVGAKTRDGEVVIENLTVAGSLQSAGELGALIGGAVAGSISINKCVNRAHVVSGSDDSAAGFIMYTSPNAKVSISDSVNEGHIEGGWSAAGFIAELGGAGELVRCTNAGSVESLSHAAGIVARYEPSEGTSFSIDSCANVGAIGQTGDAMNGTAGGILGFVEVSGKDAYERCTISNSYNTGDITARYGVGGIVGRIYYVPIDLVNVYNRGAIHSSNDKPTDVTATPGGIIGYLSYNGTWNIIGAYNSGAVSTETAAKTKSGAILGCVNMFATVNFDRVFYEQGCADTVVANLTKWNVGQPVVNGDAVSLSPAELTANGAEGGAARVGRAFSDDTASVNGGYPVLFWQKGESPRSIANASLSPVADVTYTGSPVVPDITLTDGSYTLVKGADYRIEDLDNVEVSDNAKVRVVGVGAYEGSLEVTFAIVGGAAPDPEPEPDPDPNPTTATIEVYTQDGDDQSTRTLVATFDGTALDDMASRTMAGGYFYSSDGSPKVIAAMKHVSISTLLSRAGVSLGGDDALKVTDASRLQTSYTVSAADLNAQGNFYPSYSDTDTTSTEGAYAVEPAIALTWAAAPVSAGTLAQDAYYQATQSTSRQTTPRFVMGVSEAHYLAGSYAGARFVNNVGSLTVVKNATAPEPSKPSFSDVDLDAWYAPAVAFVSSKGLMRGYDDSDAFGVGKTLTRAELAMILWRHTEPDAAAAYVAKGASNETSLPDIADGMWYTGAANWAVANGVITGFEHESGPNTFEPSTPVSFEQMATVISRMSATDEEVSSVDVAILDSFRDPATVSDWARQRMAWAVSKSLVNGYDEPDGKYLRAGEDVMRERAAKLLMNAFELNLLK